MVGQRHPSRPAARRCLHVAGVGQGGWRRKASRGETALAFNTTTEPQHCQHIVRAEWMARLNRYGGHALNQDVKRRSGKPAKHHLNRHRESTVPGRDVERRSGEPAERHLDQHREQSPST